MKRHPGFGKIFPMCLLGLILLLGPGANTGGSVFAASAATDDDQTQTAVMRKSESVVHLVAVGDDLIHAGVYHRQYKNGKYNFDSIYKEIRDDVQEADLAVINQETIMVPKKYSGYPRFGSPYAVADAVAKAGFNVVTHATNHTNDRGTDAILGTLKYWNKHYPDISVLGIHKSQKAANIITVVEKQGIRFALLNYTYGLNGLNLPSGKRYMVDMLTTANASKIRKDIRRAKKLSDFVIVFPHWGTEYTYKASFSQRYWTKLFLAEGVDLVIGAHPHVVQPFKMLKGKDGHKMLVYYSLGNFITAQTRWYCMLEGMAQVTIVKDEKGTRIRDYDMEPLIVHRQGGARMRVYKLREYTEEMAKKHSLHKRYPDKITVKYMKKFYKKITGHSVD